MPKWEVCVDVHIGRAYDVEAPDEDSAIDMALQAARAEYKDADLNVPQVTRIEKE